MKGLIQGRRLSNVQSVARAKGALQAKGDLRAKGALRANTWIFTHCKNIPLYQISALYVHSSSNGTRFCVSATKQTTPIDGAFQKTTKQFCRASPETQFAQASSSNSKNEDYFCSKNPRTEGTYMCYWPHKTPLKKVTSSLRSEVIKRKGKKGAL